jgi:hypothetical protein
LLLFLYNFEGVFVKDKKKILKIKAIKTMKKNKSLSGLDLNRISTITSLKDVGIRRLKCLCEMATGLG